MRWPIQLQLKKEVKEAPKANEAPKAEEATNAPVTSVSGAKALPLSFEEQLHNGYYLGILESYDVRWSKEKAIRDILQNFFDSKKTLDNIDVTISQLPDEESLARPLCIQISGPEEFDYKKLIHLGGSSKTGDPSSAGGFGEGAKIAALVLMRDYGCRQIIYNSKDWQLEFFLQAPPTDSYDVESTKGLYVRLNRRNNTPGNSIEIITTDSSFPSFINDAKNLFYHKNNPDFQNPSFSTSLQDGAQFGFKILPRDQNAYSKFDSGHFYDAGQRRHYETTDKGWAQVEGMHIWCIGRKTFGDDRDRGAVSRTNFEEKFLKNIISELSVEKCIDIVTTLKDAWPNESASFYQAIAKLLETASNKLKRAGVKLDFPPTLLATDGFTPMYISSALETAGYTLCRGHLANIGMQSALSRFSEMQSHLKIEPTPVQEQKCQTLRDAVGIILQNLTKEEIKNIWLYNQANEKSIIQGQYNESFVWMAEECLDQEFFQALATYLHELDHKHGSDQSAEFSYALTDTLGKVIEAYGNNYTLLSELRSKWDALNKKNGDVNI